MVWYEMLNADGRTVYYFSENGSGHILPKNFTPSNGDVIIPIYKKAPRVVESSRWDGVFDEQMINVCKKIRNLAKLDRLRVDLSEHNANVGINTHLFRYLEYCGKNIDDYVKEYLSNLQPFMLERLESQEYDKDYVCVLDTAYKVSLYIKIYKKQYDELVVSFHESNKAGTGKLARSKFSEYVFVFEDKIVSRGSNSLCISVMFQKGVKAFNVNISAEAYKDGFIVSRSGLDAECVNYCNEILDDIYIKKAGLTDEDIDNFESFDALKQLTFTSFGRDVASNISLLIDSAVRQTDMIGRQSIFTLLDIFVASLDMTKTQCNTLIDVIKNRYRVTSSKIAETLSEKVVMQLSQMEEDV